MDECIFCRIGRKELPAELIYEDTDVIAFKDIHPKAPIHILIVPKKHLEHVGFAADEDENLLGHLLLTARTIAHSQSLDGFKIHINNGSSYGQTVPHLHLHLLSGQFAKDALQSL
jgi:histidine triad (HIT) family protein